MYESEGRMNACFCFDFGLLISTPMLQVVVAHVVDEERVACGG